MNRNKRAVTLDLRKPFDKERARRVKAAQKAHSIGISDIGYFDNLLHHDRAIRQKKHDFMMRVFDAAALLGVDAERCAAALSPDVFATDEAVIDRLIYSIEELL